MLTPPNNRLAQTAAASLDSLQRMKRNVSAKVAGVDVTGFLSAEGSASDPMSGGMLGLEQRTLMVSKEQLPNRPEDNVSVVIAGDELAALEVIDREGYWALLVGAELG